MSFLYGMVIGPSLDSFILTQVEFLISWTWCVSSLVLYHPVIKLCCLRFTSTVVLTIPSTSSLYVHLHDDTPKVFAILGPSSGSRSKPLHIRSSLFLFYYHELTWSSPFSSTACLSVQHLRITKKRNMLHHTNSHNG